MSDLKKGDKIRMLNGGEATIVGEFGSGGQGTGSTNINLAGNVLSATQSGITVVNGGNTQDLIINQTDSTINGSSYGINSRFSGKGIVDITAGGNISGNTAAIYVNDGGSSTDARKITISDGGVVENASKSTSAQAINVVSTKNYQLMVNKEGVLNGTIALGTGQNTLTNEGTWNTEGASNFGLAGTNALTNNGLIQVANNNNTSNVTTTFQNLNNFTNGENGILSLSNDVTGDTLIIDGNYIGAGGTVLFDTVLNGDDACFGEL